MSHGLKSGDRAGHSTSPLRDQTPREQQQQSPDVHRSKPLWVLTTVEANQPHDTTPTSLPPLQPSQCPFEKWEIFMPHPVLYNLKLLKMGYKYTFIDPYIETMIPN